MAFLFPKKSSRKGASAASSEHQHQHLPADGPEPDRPMLRTASSSLSIKSSRSTRSQKPPSVHADDLVATFSNVNAQPASRRISNPGTVSSPVLPTLSTLSVTEAPPLSAGSSQQGSPLQHPKIAGLKIQDANDSGILRRPLGSRQSSFLSTTDGGSSIDGSTYSPDDESFTDALETPLASGFSTPVELPPPSSKPDYSIPDPSESPLRADIRQVFHAVMLFLNSRMIEAEKICETKRHERLYYALGHSTLNSLKALMTFEPHDLSAAIELCKETLDIAAKEKAKVRPGQMARSWSDRVIGAANGLVKGSSLTVEALQRMSTEQRHAELAYAECLLIKGLVDIIYAGDFMAFLREALNMRTAFAIYRTLGRWVTISDEKSAAGIDPEIDVDLRSGIDFGNGQISLVLSLLPSAAIRVMDMFGISGSRKQSLETLMRPGGWKTGVTTPATKPGPGTEGLRRTMCDLVLLVYHLIISTIIPITDVDMELADNILHYNLARSPNGVFWLYFSGRLYATQTQGERAIEQYKRAIASQKDYRQIQHICHWDLCLVYCSLGDFPEAYKSVSILAAESNWSKAAYAYCKAVTLMESIASGQEDRLGEDEKTRGEALNKKIADTMHSVPTLMQKIAGKSLPFEKFCNRRSKRFFSQGHRLCLAGVELTYMLNALNLSSRRVLCVKQLPEVEKELARLTAIKDGAGFSDGELDDFCLANFFKGVILYFIARPDAQIKPDPPESPIPYQEADEAACKAFDTVLAHSVELKYDHHLAWFTHYEYGRLLAAMGKAKEAKEHFSTILEGRVKLSPKRGKGKVSLQNVVVLRANAAMDLLKADK